MIQFTHYDIQVGTLLVEALVKQATSLPGMPITFGDLFTLARSLHPKDPVLARALPVDVGPKLLIVEGFCKSQGYPNLACLAVNRTTQRPAPTYTGDWEADKREVAGFDWSGANAQVAAYADTVRATIPARMKPRKERPADVAWYAYYCSHRAACEMLTQEDKREIINLLMGGLDPESALKRVLAAKDDSGTES